MRVFLLLLTLLPRCSGQAPWSGQPPSRQSNEEQVGQPDGLWSGAVEEEEWGSGDSALEAPPEVLRWAARDTVGLCEPGEVCNVVQGPDGEGPQRTLVFRYCHCGARLPSCSEGSGGEDPFTHLTLNGLQYKTCRRQAHIPVCRGGGGLVAKVWYGEDLPRKLKVYCRCGPGLVWAPLRCTSSGRLCFVTECLVP